MWECIEAEGTDERHVKLLPSIPRFKVRGASASLMLLLRSCLRGADAQGLPDTWLAFLTWVG